MNKWIALKKFYRNLFRVKEIIVFYYMKIFQKFKFSISSLKVSFLNIVFTSNIYPIFYLSVQKQMYIILNFRWFLIQYGKQSNNSCWIDINFAGQICHIRKISEFSKKYLSEAALRKFSITNIWQIYLTKRIVLHIKSMHRLLKYNNFHPLLSVLRIV